MLLEDFSAPGFNSYLIETLRSWGIKSLTTIQRLSLEAGVATGESLVVCAPTSSGKTLVGEMAILSALSEGKKCIYLVSHKALADQKYIDFENCFGNKLASPISVGLSTGDREEGEIIPQVLVATYEKALALFLSGQMDVAKCLVIADELQILGEEGRGPNIEALCSVFRQQELAQLIALTATVGNPEELANWLGCKLVASSNRDVELNQQIWINGQAHSINFGNDVGNKVESDVPFSSNALDAVEQLLSNGQGPVLVFTESKREAVDYANTYSERRTRTVNGIAISDTLDLFSEPTEASEQLKNNAQRQVAFHTADLTSQERQVIEEGFLKGHFDVCFATSTLAAGVNFPFQSVVFPKITYDFGDRGGSCIKRSDYRNMSGRAGRLGMHDRGYAILLPQNARELSHANDLVLPENDKINSQLVNISMRRCILMLISSRIIDHKDKVRSFFENTYYWYQISEHNPKKLDDIIAKAEQSLDWLAQSGLIEVSDQVLLPTPLGKAVSQSGLLPSTAMDFLKMMVVNVSNLETNFENYIPGIIHWVCGCNEFRGKNPSRFLVWPAGRNPVSSANFLSSNRLLSPLDRTDNQVNQCAHALTLYCSGLAERQIRFQTNIPSGGVHRLAMDIAWVIDGLQRIASVQDLNYPQTLTNKISMLSRCVRWGAPAEALDILRIAQRENVPGFGRQRVMALLSQGLSTFSDILSTTKDNLISILRNEDRATALLNAVSSSSSFQSDRYEKVHAKLATELGLSEAVSACNTSLGTAYEDAVKQLLEAELRWSIKTIDDGKQQNVPDLLLALGEISILIECKTTTKSPPLIKKEDAFAVLQKAVDFDSNIHRLTLGKPGFDEHSKKKVLGARDITLIEHSIFIEGVLRVISGVVDPIEFMKWLSAPGLAELSRLSGPETYQIRNPRNK